MHNEKVWVNVETAFPDGLVVSFTDECGAEYRGALLKQTSAPPLITGPSHKLANPLSLLHDHPYAKIQKFGKKVCREVPAKVLLGWSTAGLVQTPNHAVSTRNGFVRNQKKHKMIAVIESDEGAGEDWPRERRACRPYSRHEDRNAKVLATLKMRSSSEEYSVQGSTRVFSKTLHAKKHKPKVAKGLRRRKQSSTAQPGNTKSSVPSKVNPSSLSVTTQAYTTGPRQSVAKDSMVAVQSSKPCTPPQLAGRSTCTVDISPTKVHHRMSSTGQFSSSSPPSASVPQTVPGLSSGVPIKAEISNDLLPVEGSSPATPLKHVKTFSIPLKKITVSSPSSIPHIP